MKNDTTIMLPVHRSNIPFANECIKHLLDNSDLGIVCIDDFGKDEDYIKNDRLSFIHNTFTDRQSLVKIWNQCIKECPTDNVIIASWRQRPTIDTFDVIRNRLNDGYGLVTFDGLHFFGINKYLTNVIGFFDEGFTRGQYEDTDWFNRLMTNNIAVYIGNIAEDRSINGQRINSMWTDGSEENKLYYQSKWIENQIENKLIQLKDEVNIYDRTLFSDKKKISYRPWSDSVLSQNISNYFNIFKTYVKAYDN